MIERIDHQIVEFAVRIARRDEAVEFLRRDPVFLEIVDKEIIGCLPAVRPLLRLRSGSFWRTYCFLLGS